MITRSPKMILAIVCLIFAPAVFGQRGVTSSAHLRVSDTEKFFYSGLDHRIVNGWSDDRSSNLQSAYGVILAPAQNLAQLNFSQNGAWRIEAREQGYQAKEEDEIIFRIRADAAVNLVFFAGPAEGNEPVQYRFSAGPQWHLEHVSLHDLGKPVELRAVELRNDSPNRATVYVGYMYLKVNPKVVPKEKKLN